MMELITNLTWVIVGIVVVFVVVYSLVRLIAIAWHKTKSEYDALLHVNRQYPERKHQNDEELQHGEEEN